MARIPSTLDTGSQPDLTGRVAVVAGLIAALYFGSAILIPVALAVLIAFAIVPAVKVLQKVGLGRVLPVLITVLFTFVLAAGLAALMATQLRDLSNDLPRYESTVVRKVEAVKGLADGASIRRIEAAVARITRLFGAADKPATAAGSLGTPSGIPSIAQTDKGPMLVEVVTPALQPMDAIKLVLSPLLHPLSTAFIVVVFVIFILLQREDLRNRAIRLFGASDLQRATAAINDGGRRLSRYLLAQCALNAGAGLTVGTGLWIIGVPSSILLGILFCAARFVPYIGPVIGSVLPIALALAVDPGWSMVLWTLAMLAVVEVSVGQFIEPVAYGHHTGLSPVAIVVAATFWTVLWGPVGLFLSTPLTVCLVVLGRHVESLAVLDVLLGDRPPLTPAETFYQRLLANDPVEAAELARRQLGSMSIGRYYDDVALPALLMAQDDAANGRLDVDRQERIRDAALEVVEDLSQEDAAELRPVPGSSGPDGDDHARTIDDLVPDRAPVALRQPGSVLCIGARTPLDDASATMLVEVFTDHGIGAVAESAGRLGTKQIALLDLSRARMVVLGSLDGSSPAYLRFVLRRLRRHAPHVEIVIGAWWRRDGDRETDAEIDAALPQVKVASFVDAVRHCFADAARTDVPAKAPPLSAAS